MRAGRIIFAPWDGGPEREVMGIDQPVAYGLWGSSDGNTLYYTKLVQIRADIYLLENFE